MEPGLSSVLTAERELTVTLSGDWSLLAEEVPLDEVLDALASDSVIERVSFDASGLGQWDSALIIALVALRKTAEEHDREVDETGLPRGARQLLELAFAVPDRAETEHREPDNRFLYEVGESTLSVLHEGRLFFAFTGRVTHAFGRLLRGKAAYSGRDFGQYVQEAGVEALPIVSLISLLIGMIFAFVGAMQLQYFGAGIYTADLVGVAMVREMAPIMTGIIMAGRTGASYAAQIGTMKVNEEIDALTTLGINAIDYLVLPRIMALVLMMPLLTLYADFMGIVGGLLVGVVMLDISPMQYLQQTLNAITLSHLFGGLFKATVYGSLVAMAGCQQGMACGGSALAVGQCTTRAVVMGIVAIVISASLLTIIYINLGI